MEVSHAMRIEEEHAAMSLALRIAVKCFSQAKRLRFPSASEITHSVVVPGATYSPWISDKDFSSTYTKIKSNTLVDIYRAYELWSLVQETCHLTGDILEVGVWRGGTGCLLAERAKRVQPGATIFLCDTFKGVVKAGAKDTHYRGGEHANTSMDTVRKLAGTMGLANVELLEGVFPEQTGDRIKDRHFSLCHIDVDVYESAKQVTEWVWPRLLPGGVIVYDDYGFRTCEGVTKLVNEHFQGPEALTLHNLNGHAIIVKR